MAAGRRREIRARADRERLERRDAEVLRIAHVRLLLGRDRELVERAFAKPRARDREQAPPRVLELRAHDFLGPIELEDVRVERHPALARERIELGDVGRVLARERGAQLGIARDREPDRRL